jgi:branched-chain amino acid transport system ATP-binding protein
MNSPLLRVQQLHKAFGGVSAVGGVSFDLHAGEMLALIGPNGAGKSTTFNLLNGQLQADSGEICLDSGQSLRGLKPRQIQRLGVGRTFQITQTFRSLTVLENVQTAWLSHTRKTFHWTSRPVRQATHPAQELLNQVGLGLLADRPSHTLSYGDQKRLELAMVLAGQPRVLLMDEPTAGMALSERLALMALAKQLAQERQMGVLFTEHHLEVVFGFADRVAVMAQGQLVALDSPSAVQQVPAVKSLYLCPDSPSSAPPPDAASHPKAPPPPCLQVQDLWAGYGPAQVLRGLSLKVHPGEVVALMGRNGAGKSTTLKTLMGLLPPQQGKIELLGQDVTGAAPHTLAQRGLGYVPEERRIFTDLTVLENLNMAKGASRLSQPTQRPPAWNLERVFTLFPLLVDLQHRRADRLSGGEQQILSVARTLMGNPGVLLLDEPSEGVAPQVVAQMTLAVQTLKAEGVGILLCEQNDEFTRQVADRTLWLDNGVLHDPSQS